MNETEVCINCLRYIYSSIIFEVVWSIFSGVTWSSTPLLHIINVFLRFNLLHYALINNWSFSNEMVTRIMSSANLQWLRYWFSLTDSFSGVKFGSVSVYFYTCLSFAIDVCCGFYLWIPYINFLELVVLLWGICSRTLSQRL